MSLAILTSSILGLNAQKPVIHQRIQPDIGEPKELFMPEAGHKHFYDIKDITCECDKTYVDFKFKNILKPASCINKVKKQKPTERTVPQVTSNPFMFNLPKYNFYELAKPKILWPYPIQAQKVNDIKQPKVAKPDIKMDVTKNLYEGPAEFLDIFLGNGKLKGKGQQFLNAQKKYGINAIFLIAITNIESANGTSKLAVRNNNFGGMKGRKGWLKFKSIDDGIDALASNLKRKYIDDGLTTIEKINKRYAENPKWGKTIVAKMNKMYKTSQCKIFKF